MTLLALSISTFGPIFLLGLFVKIVLSMVARQTSDIIGEYFYSIAQPMSDSELSELING